MSGSLLAFNLYGFGEASQRWLVQLKPDPLGSAMRSFATISLAVLAVVVVLSSLARAEEAAGGARSPVAKEVRSSVVAADPALAQNFRDRAHQLEQTGVIAPFKRVAGVLVACALVVVLTFAFVTIKKPDFAAAAAYYGLALSVLVLAFFYVRMELVVWRYNVRIMYKLVAVADAIELAPGAAPADFALVVRAVSPGEIPLDQFPESPTDALVKAVGERIAR